MDFDIGHRVTDYQKSKEIVRPGSTPSSNQDTKRLAAIAAELVVALLATSRGGIRWGSQRSAARWAGLPGAGSRVRRRRRAQDGGLHVRRVLLLRGRGGRCPGLRGSPICEQRQGEVRSDPARRTTPGTHAHILESWPLGASLVPAWARGCRVCPRAQARGDIARGGEAKPSVRTLPGGTRSTGGWPCCRCPGWN